MYNILTKEREGELKDRPKTPHRQPRKTPAATEEQVLAAKDKTRLGPKRLAPYLAPYEGLEIPWATIRHILPR